MKIKKTYSYDFNSNPDTHIDKKTIKKWIKEGIAKLETNKEDYWYTASGDSMVIVFREHKHAYEVIIVNKGYKIRDYKVKK